MRLFRNILIAALAAAATVSAADFWQVKPPSEWSAKEIERLLTKSPWAREKNVTIWSLGDHSGDPLGGGATDPAAVKEGPRPPSTRLVVRFESAAPLRAAATPGVTAGQVETWAKDFYVITASGLPADQPGMVRFVVKGKAPVAPARVETLLTPDGPLAAFLFPRSQAIVLEDKEVTFEIRLGIFPLKTSFQLKDMVYQGRLAL